MRSYTPLMEALNCSSITELMEKWKFRPYKKSIVLFLSLCFPFICMADYCFKTFEDDKETAKAIFVGKVVKIEQEQFWYYGLPKSVFTIEVKESFKGLRKGVGYLSLIGPVNGCCNINFQLDSTFLVFAYSDSEDSKMFWTNDCSNTGLLSEQKDLIQKLGVPLTHEISQRQRDYFNYEDLKLDSLENSISELDIQLAALQESNKGLNQHRTILIISLCLLAVFTAISIAVKRKF